MTNLISITNETFLPMAGSNANKAAIAKVVEKLPELTEKAKSFGRQNTQTTISLMTLTMMNGHSPMRMLRQVLAEVDRRKRALSESQISYVRAKNEIKDLQSVLHPTELEVAELRHALVNMEEKERYINGAFKDIAILIDNYERIKEAHNIADWDEHTFEVEEKRHHIRQGFMMLYRNIIQMGRATESPMEYLMQFGVHVQTAVAEVTGYINVTNERIANGELLTARDTEDFLDTMSHKYKHCADEVTDRIFGKKDILNPEYMSRLEVAE